MIGLDHPDDAGVYRVSNDLALIQTVDFFTPVVDDPYHFGLIAAANALSDVYAMGGIPKTAMNLVGFPADRIDISVLRQILQGGIDKIKEAGVVLVGGHTIEDVELKYGLSVTGFIHPDKVLKKKNLKSGDSLILTKPLGTGIVNTAIKGGVASDEITEHVTQIMAALNKEAAEIMVQYPVHACTDITGFGLLGHIAEMVEDSRVGVRIDSEKVPVIPGALELAKMGLIPAGTYKNRDFRESMIEMDASVSRPVQDILFDPQTSGGLLICIDKESAVPLLGVLHEGGEKSSAIIGEVLAEPISKIIVT